ncbi:syntaxin-11a [Alosa pseudoharengus]|uniref:syntaxin-11a n=1 Tax=Alosa pseudoharengus TaxID=34774 RepID=UPI003F8CECFA
MRDRLCELHSASRLTDAAVAVEAGPEDTEQVEVVFEGEEEMDEAFKEVQAMHKEIAHLRMEVKQLGKQNTRFLTSMRRISSIKRDSNSIARGIKARSQALYARLQKMEARCQRLEQEHGAHSSLARMVRGQCASLTTAFHGAMSLYNEAEMEQRDNCKKRIQRQAEIVGQEVTGEQIEEMIESGKWNAFSENLVADGRAARSALCEIENRQKELLELEGRIRDIHELFFQLALLVEEQGTKLDNIEANVGSTQDYVAKATVQIKKAVRYKKANPCRRFFCCCFPCCNK